MIGTYRSRYLLIPVIFLAGLGLAFALPVIGAAKQQFNTKPHSPRSGENMDYPGSAENDCPGFPMSAANENQLNQAIACFNALDSAVSVTLTLQNDISLTASTLPISNTVNGVSLTVEGETFTLDAQEQAGVRPVWIYSDTHVTITGLTIKGGNSTGLTDDEGGGILTFGHLTLENSIIKQNYARDGGGMYAAEKGTSTIVSSKFISNTAEKTGGGLRSGGESTIFINKSIFQENSAGENGGGIYNGGNAHIHVTNSQIIDNACTGIDEECAGGFAGGAGATTTITGSRIFGNHSAREGGGIRVGAGHRLTLENSTVYQNKADLRGAGIHIGGGGRIVMFNSTVSGNEVLTATYSSEMGGGGISVSAGGRMEIQYSTITSNTTALSIREGILITSQADLKMDSSIIANHIDDCLNLGSGSTFSDGGFNFVGDSSSPGSCPFPISILSGDPLLAPLADNGGKTKTHALLPDSKAIDQIPVNFCTVPNDQRNWPRPRGAGCDIGAYERAFTVYTPIVFKE